MDALKNQFDKARKLYPGTKRGLNTEFDNFCKRHKDWREVVVLLYPAVEKQIVNRNSKIAQNQWQPSWKHFKTWINNRCWECTEGSEVDEKVRNNEEEKRRTNVREAYQEFFECQSVEKLKELRQERHLAYIAGWLIDEIINRHINERKQ